MKGVRTVDEEERSSLNVGSLSSKPIQTTGTMVAGLAAQVFLQGAT